MRHYTNMLNAARGSEIMSGATFSMDLTLKLYDYAKSRTTTENDMLGFKGEIVNQREHTNSVGTVQRGIQKYLREMSMFCQEYENERGRFVYQWLNVTDIYNSGSVVIVEFQLNDLKEVKYQQKIAPYDLVEGLEILNGSIEIIVESHGADEGRMRETLVDFLDKKLKRKYSIGRMK